MARLSRLHGGRLHVVPRGNLDHRPVDQPIAAWQRFNTASALQEIERNLRVGFEVPLPDQLAPINTDKANVSYGN